MGQHLLQTGKLLLTQDGGTFGNHGRAKEDIQKTICPKVLWSGDVEINKSLVSMEVHQQLGPSLNTVFRKVGPPSERQLVHLMLEMVSKL